MKRLFLILTLALLTAGCVTIVQPVEKCTEVEKIVEVKKVEQWNRWESYRWNDTVNRVHCLEEDVTGTCVKWTDGCNTYGWNPVSGIGYGTSLGCSYVVPNNTKEGNR